MNNDSCELTISANDNIDEAVLENYYSEEKLSLVVQTALDDISTRLKDGLTLPYFADSDNWLEAPKMLDLYITDLKEGQQLNLEARGKDYATNILSYPSDFPEAILALLPALPLGELIICHEVMAREAAEQHKTLDDHIQHLLVHGMLHLLGFDHELGKAEQEEMESFEIAILARLGIANPYQ
ncbi:MULTISPECIES: rRNA maturation RNase YbeY [Psychrobacter]|uniref:rRNA maturation RNase YbeY n=1 Tax=Psychrobacter TaxID=497 RepID=UPI00146B5729|nr:MULTISPECIES: rRNA maturation RNase YbeY [Psychrobacter]